jgi:probable HAF family extracellular repeat protein
MRTQVVVSVCLLVLVSLLVSSASAVTQYVITDLGTLGGGESLAYGINNAAQVVGQSRSTGAYSYAFLWESGVMQDLCAGGPDGCANGINDHGRVVGWWVGSGATHSFYWEFGNAYRIFPSILSNNQALDVNEHDQIVGFPWTEAGAYHAYLWDDWAWQDLDTLGGSASIAYGINDGCQVVGEADTTAGLSHAFIWEAGAIDDLGTLGGDESCANAINGLGLVVGWADTEGQFPHAFLWQGGALEDLGTLDGDWSKAYAINDGGRIVGGVDVLGHWAGHAFLWEDGTMYDLNDLVVAGSGWILEAATDINEAGLLVGYGINPDGFARGFLLTPIPEPCALAVMGLGPLGLVLRRRRLWVW